MDRTLAFRRGLTRRLMGVALVTMPSAALTLTNCGGGSTAGQGGDATAMPVESCFPWPAAADGGGTGGADAGGSGGAGGAGGKAGIGGAGGALACPAQADATNQFMMGCGVSVKSEGTLKNGQCCYTVIPYSCFTGRPFLAEGRVLTAPRAARGAWDVEGLRPRTAGLSPELLARLSAAWTRDGLLEHASVASFSRFALELMAAGAPSDLVELAHRAALDEVRHARLCLSLAGAYAGEPIAPGPFPFDGRVEVTSDLASIAARAAREGCIGETLAAVQAAEQHMRATDPAVRAALAAVAEDEARHAELAYRTVAWALRTGGAPVREAVTRAFADVLSGVAVIDPGTDPFVEGMSEHGQLDSATLREVLERALNEVVRPSAQALLSAAQESRS